MTYPKIRFSALVRLLAKIGGLVGMGLLTSCSPLNVLNGLGSDSGYRNATSIPYGDKPRQRLDIYQPNVTRNGIVVVFFYGGSWNMGERAQYRFVAQTLTRHGATVVIADYRLYPEVVYPAFMQDAAEAVAWTYRNIAHYGGDSKKIYLVGHSAGAHIATLLALDTQFLAVQGLRTDVLAGVVGLATPADFAAKLGAQYRPVFIDQARLDLAQPVRYVRGDAPPMLLQHGTDDSVVLPRNSQVLADKIRAAGGRARAIIYPGTGHSGMLLIFSEILGRSPILDDTLNFLGLSR